VQLCAENRRAGDAAVGPVDVPHDRIRQTGLEVGFLGLIGKIRGVGLQGRL
jgi:hypothetical protein